MAHGCTGKGNDQVRFELAIKRFAPEMTIIAPWREWSIKGRDEEIDYAEESSYLAPIIMEGTTTSSTISSTRSSMYSLDAGRGPVRLSCWEVAGNIR